MSLFEVYFAVYVPSVLQEEGQQAISKLIRELSEEQSRKLESILKKSPELAQQLIRAFLGSDYLLEACCRDTDLLFDWLLVDIPVAPLTPFKIVDTVRTVFANELTETEFDQRIRWVRRRLMTGLYWRDLNGLADFSEVSQAMTAMAQLFIQQTLDFHYQRLTEQHGIPLGKTSGEPQPLLVIGMGKLGGAELNVSSDVDLIFAFPEAGATSHRKASIDNQHFFTLLGQCLIKSLNENTVDGFVFRVDMRLRPYGQSGALTSNFSALENYYEAQGRDWERYALIKARPVACSQLPDAKQSKVLERQATENFYSIINPFVYRKYLDYSSVDALRQTKALIVKEIRRKGLMDDIKLGEGGIREIEFIAQSFQLIRGGRDARLQERNLLAVLKILQKLNHLSRDVAKGLTEAYLFLRKTEHSLQAYQDTQTQQLPSDTTNCERLAWVMGFATWSAFSLRLQHHRNIVSSSFQQVVADPETKRLVKQERLLEWQLLWQNTDDGKDFLHSQGFKNPETIISILSHFQQRHNIQALSGNAREKLDVLLPQLLQTTAQITHAQTIEKDETERVLNCLLSWLEAVVNRTSYMLLLLENPQVQNLLVTLFAASTWIADTLKQMPSLLDELLYPENLFSLPEKGTLKDELRQQLLRIKLEDIEAHMETLRYFRLAHNLRVAVCEVIGSLPLMKVSDYLTFIAEVTLEQTMQLATKSLTEHHGYPEGTSDEMLRFLVVGYGKLGGLEMSYASDLDLVFIYDADAQGMTTGKIPLDNQTFYTRLGKKIIHMLTTRTLSGKLYEVDMRLRPSGDSGLLVSSLSGYSRYELRDAWSWEHQALVRARAIAGDQDLAKKFINLRRQVLCQPRDLNSLKQDVIQMRKKMCDELGSQKASQKIRQKPGFHLKHDEGGIVDIEFMVQYAILAWSHQQPALTGWTDNIRLIENLHNYGFIETQKAARLIEIYKSYRMYRHRLSLKQEETYVVSDGLFEEERQEVVSIWNSLFSRQSQIF